MNSHKLAVISTICLVPVLCYGAGNEVRSSVRLDPAKYTIYIQNLGRTGDHGDVLLQLHNNCSFRIMIPIACCEKKGELVEEILPLFSLDQVSGTVETPNLKEDVVDEHWLALGQSTKFRVSAKYARSKRTVYVPFHYEWELDGQGTRSGVGEPEHYVLFNLGTYD